jgi:hypothetical protein
MVYEAILIFLLYINPLYWLLQGFFTLFYDQSSIASVGTAEIFTPAAWAIISIFLAEHASQRRGNPILWFLFFFITNVWGYLYFYYTEERTMKAQADTARARHLVSPSTRVTDLVGGAVKVCSPVDLKEFHIQDLVESRRFDEAIEITRSRMAFYEEKGEAEKIAQYRSMVQWIEGAKNRFEDELIEEQYGRA